MFNNVAIKNDVVELYLLNQKMSLTSFQKSIYKQNIQNRLNRFIYIFSYIVFINIWVYK